MASNLPFIIIVVLSLILVAGIYISSPAGRLYQSQAAEGPGGSGGGGGRPDLIVDSLSVTILPGSGGNVTVNLTAKIKNIGYSSTGYSYTNFNIPGLLWMNFYTPALNPGQFINVTYNVSSIRGINYYATATADKTGLVAELNEGNNQVTITFST